ncbi:hypothetical protein P8452_27632 [Trifolium repens]|nr:hypothetical protein P8452_27632 [Trifolium repens]
MVYANWFIEKNFAKLEADALKKKLDLSLKAIFEEYNNSVGGGVGGSQGESEPTKSNRQIGNPSYYYDWLGGSPTPLPTQEDMEDLEKIERDVFSQNLSDGVNTCVNLDED